MLSVAKNSAPVQAAVVNVDSTQNVQRLPATKRVQGVKRVGPWHSGFSTAPVDTPWKISYNDGRYTGYLYRQTMSQEYRNGKIRWVVYYGGTVHLK
ncbi:hypothetical protein [uncultured Lactobacillus sp.]|uniref:hypothetical protein n=1 Tax=uncultured Lactobacillus sp. TaxID=153152 RepID=UPI00262C1E1D|nr:hypothetical protein [uncultured Lactobacillus sp.]